MEKTRDIHKELKNLREEVMFCFSKTRPAKEFGATMILAIVRLHMIEARIRRTRNLNERRRLIHEFTRGRSAVEKKLRLPRQDDRKGSVHTGQEYRNAMP